MLITYMVDNGPTNSAHWLPGEYDPSSKSVFAPERVRDSIIDAMLEGAISVDVVFGDWESGFPRFNFQVEGFPEAYKPVIAYCAATG